MKKRMIRVLALALIAALTIGCMAGCSSGKTTTTTTETSSDTTSAASTTAASGVSDKKAALVLFGTTFDYFVYIGAGAKQAAEEAGLQLDVLTTNDHVELSEKITQVATNKYDACIVIGSPTIMADYQALGEAGIPVITYDSMVDGFDFNARVGSDNYTLGAQAGAEAVKYLQSLDTIEGEVICLNCPEGETMNSRAQGFMDTVAEAFPDLTINEQKLASTDISAEGAQTYVDNLLVGKPKGTVSVIFGANAGMAMGATAACSTAGRTDIALFGIDNEAGQLQDLEDGTYYKATVAQQPVKIGQECVRAAVAAVQGESLGDIRLEGIVITPENVADFTAQQTAEYEALAPYKP